VENSVILWKMMTQNATGLQPFFAIDRSRVPSPQGFLAEVFHEHNVCRGAAMGQQARHGVVGGIRLRLHGDVGVRDVWLGAIG
jgi:hypothetical protein